MPLPQRSLAVVGAQFPNRKGPTRRFAIELAEPGQTVDLVPEPTNPADPHAIAVFSAGVQIGYLTAERAPWIGGILNQGREVACIFQERTQWGAAIRCAFDGDEPVLPVREIPQEEVSQDGGDGFWPDPIWDE